MVKSKAMQRKHISFMLTVRLVDRRQPSLCPSFCGNLGQEEEVLVLGMLQWLVGMERGQREEQMNPSPPDTHTEC